jgi:hypothetical protein
MSHNNEIHCATVRGGQIKTQERKIKASMKVSLDEGL